MIRPTPAQRRQWQEEGCLVLEKAIAGDELDRLQKAFERCARASHPAWLQGVAEGTAPAAYFDIPDPLAQDPLFIDLVDHPAYYGLLMDFADERLLFLHPQFRTIPSSPLSYVGWHYDVPRSNPLHLKVQIYLDDVGPGQGAFAYVPGSHKADSGPYLPVRRLESMPGHRAFCGEAGTALLFNSYGMHTSMLNDSGRPRRSIILIYEIFTEERFEPRRYARLEERLCTPERRRLFALERYPR